MLNWIDSFLNRITMYRLVLYFLIVLLGVAMVFGLFGLMRFNPLAILFSSLFLTGVCWIANRLSAWIFKAPVNVESVYITALILALIISPLSSSTDARYFTLAIAASVIAITSKFLLAIRNKHVFNPAAVGVAITAVTLGLSASWWVGTLYMLPFVLVGGILIARKIRREDLVISFFAVAILTILSFGFFQGFNLISLLKQALIDTPLFFFAFVMLTEPLTTPPTRKLAIIYGAIVGFLFAPYIHIGSFYFTPETALLAGNLFSYLVSPKAKLLLKLARKELVGEQTYDFVFRPDRKFTFTPGQYMEWTLDQTKTDSRGNRRFFTIASSPTEEEVRMGVKFYPNPSTFKQRLMAMNPGDRIVASQIAGDFTLPADASKKLVFIAGGIGVTPFRSMIKYLADRNEKRDIVFFYSNKIKPDIAYSEIFDDATSKLGFKMIYTLTDKEHFPADWTGKTGYIDATMLQTEIPDYAERTFYLSGPHAMVTAFDETLQKLGVSRLKIKKDFFPGFV